MSSTTLSPTDVQSGFIADLKAYPTLTNTVNAEVREQNWMGDSFKYPAIRVAFNRLREMPLNGNCKGLWWMFDISIHVYVNQPSSKDCLDLMGVIGKRYAERQLLTAVFRTQPLDVDYIPPTPYMGETFGWRGEVIVSGRLKVLN